MIPCKQLSLNDIFADCQENLKMTNPRFLSLLEQHIDLDEIISITFCNHFYAPTGRTRKYPLNAFLWALIIQHIFSIPTDQLLLTFLHYANPLREFYGFNKVPDASKITRFKQDFLDDLQTVFDKLVDLTEPICQAIDSVKANDLPGDMDETVIITYSPKYKAYQSKIRNTQIDRAKKMIQSSDKTRKGKGSNDPARFIQRTAVTEDGEIAQKIFIN